MSQRCLHLKAHSAVTQLLPTGTATLEDAPPQLPAVFYPEASLSPFTLFGLAVALARLPKGLKECFRSRPILMVVGDKRFSLRSAPAPYPLRRKATSAPCYCSKMHCHARTAATFTTFASHATPSGILASGKRPQWLTASSRAEIESHALRND